MSSCDPIDIPLENTEVLTDLRTHSRNKQQSTNQASYEENPGENQGENHSENKVQSECPEMTENQIQRSELATKLSIINQDLDLIFEEQREMDNNTHRKSQIKSI